MNQFEIHQSQLTNALTAITLPWGIQVRVWTETDFAAIQRLSDLEGWPTPSRRADEALSAWQHSWPALVATEGEQVIGFVRGLTDGEVTTYIAELLIDVAHRRQGIGRLLLDVCHLLHPHARLDLHSAEESTGFYKKHGFRYIGEGLRKSYR